MYAVPQLYTQTCSVVPIWCTAQSMHLTNCFYILTTYFSHTSILVTCFSVNTSTAIRGQQLSNGADCLTASGRRHLLHARPRLKTVPAPVSNQSLRVGRARDGGSLCFKHTGNFWHITRCIPDLHQADCSTEPRRLRPTNSQNNTANKTSSFFTWHKIHIIWKTAHGNKILHALFWKVLGFMDYLIFTVFMSLQLSLVFI